MKKQYQITSRIGNLLIANVYATEVIEEVDRYELRYKEQFMGYVWKFQATIELCEHEKALDAAEVK